MPNHEVKKHNVKLIRMQSGEDIMASTVAVKSTEEIHLYDPMRLVFRRMPTGQTVMMMMPWLPVEIIKDNEAIVYQSDILSIFEPRDDLIEHYSSVLNQFEEVLNSYEEVEDDEDDEEEIEEGVKRVLH